MPLQLIHTSAKHLLDCDQPGYGTVARSEGISRILCDKLTALSGFREKSAQSLPGPQYSYRVLEYRGTTYHVMTRVQMAGADYSGRNCHIAHHLILGNDEVCALCRNPARPTPAGIMLAMENRGLWQQRWEGPPRVLTAAPAFCTDDIPDASTQPAWKRLTGHKSNARAFCTPPYENDSLVLVAPGTAGQDILALLHEADWLTHLRGWGHTFTTCGEDCDSFADTNRIVCATDNYRLIERARRASHPMLEISPAMELPEMPVDTKHPPGPESRDTAKEQPGSPVPCSCGTTATPKETATPPAEKPPCPKEYRRRRHRRMVAITASAACALCAAGWVLGVQHGAKGKPAAAATTVEPAGPGALIAELTGLAERPYDAAYTAARLDAISAQAAQGNGRMSDVTSGAIRECCRLLRTADHRVGNLRRMADCAEMLGIAPGALVALYMQQAMARGGTEHLSRAEADEWDTFLAGRPLLRDALLRSRSPYFANIFPQLPGADTVTIAKQEEPARPVVPAAERKVQTAISGAPLPEICKHISLSQVITSGELVVATFSPTGKLDTTQRIRLQPGGQSLRLHQDSESRVTLSLEENGLPSHLTPPIVIEADAGILRSITSGGRPAVLCITADADHDNVAHTMVLTPHIEIPLNDRPSLAPLDLHITEADVQRSSTAIPGLRGLHGMPGLRLTPERLTRLPALAAVAGTAFSLQLPVVVGENRLQALTPAANVSSKWVCDSSSVEGDTTIFNCRINAAPYMRQLVDALFNRLAGADYGTGIPLRATLYNMTCEMDTTADAGHMEEMSKAYVRMLANPVLNAEMSLLLAAQPDLLLTVDQARGTSADAPARCAAVCRMLARPEERAMLRRAICAALEDELRDFCERTAAKGRQGTPAPHVSYKLVLERLETPDEGGLKWCFQLQPALSE